MKKILSIFVILALLMSCNNNQKSTDNQNVESDQTASELTAQETVKQIYDEVFSLYNQHPSSEINYDEVNRKYMSQHYLKVDSIVEVIDSKHPYEVGCLDYDHWIMAQDWGNLSYAVESVEEISDTEARVSIIITNFNEKTPLTLLMVKEGDEWKIEDFITHDNVSELGVMEEYAGIEGVAP
ncbi:MAG: YbjP/YqhG family protein [Bacteroidales bacterium]|nr:YbjP/YqhG family protein [Bacteroidales bacterium]